MYHIISWYFPHASTQSSVYYGHVLLIFSGTNLWLTLLPNFLSLSLSLCPSSFLPSFLQLSICGQLLPIKTFDVRWQTMERECNQLNWTIRPPSSRTDSVSCPCTYLLVYLLDKHHFAFHSRGLSFFLSLPPSNSVLIPVDLIFTFPRTLWFVQQKAGSDQEENWVEKQTGKITIYYTHAVIIIIHIHLHNSMEHTWNRGASKSSAPLLQNDQTKTRYLPKAPFATDQHRLLHYSAFVSMDGPTKIIIQWKQKQTADKEGV